MTSIHLRCLSVLTLQSLHGACRLTGTTYEHRTYELLVTLDRNKATWPGPALILKSYASVFASTLQFVFPQSLKLSILSKHWLYANITPPHFPEGWPQRPDKRSTHISHIDCLQYFWAPNTQTHHNHNNFTFSQHGFRSRLSCEIANQNTSWHWATARQTWH